MPNPERATDTTYKNALATPEEHEGSLFFWLSVLTYGLSPFVCQSWNAFFTEIARMKRELAK